MAFLCFPSAHLRLLWDVQVKMHWVHETYWKLGPDGNNIHKTNVPNLRMRFRVDALLTEQSLVLEGAASHSHRQAKKQASKDY